MKKLIYALVVLVNICPGSFTCFSQASTTFDKAATLAEARTQLTVLSTAGGELAKYCQENTIAGEFVVDITLQGKGKVLTVFMVSSNTEINQQNLLKSKLSEIQFGNIKIPKGERIKFRHTLTF